MRRERKEEDRKMRKDLTNALIKSLGRVIGFFTNKNMGNLFTATAKAEASDYVLKDVKQDQIEKGVSKHFANTGEALHQLGENVERAAAWEKERLSILLESIKSTKESVQNMPKAGKDHTE
mgnify:CR=1 FL=1